MLVKNGLKKSRKVTKTKSLRKLKSELDKVFSNYIRLRAADQRGNAQCVSCRTWKPWTTQHCGHYVSRSHLSTRWSVKNCFVQCVSCNIFKSGNYPEFTKFILESYGQKYLKDLIEDGHEIKKWTAYDLEKEIEKYKKLIKTL